PATPDVVFPLLPPLVGRVARAVRCMYVVSNVNGAPAGRQSLLRPCPRRTSRGRFNGGDAAGPPRDAARPRGARGRRARARGRPAARAAAAAPRAAGTNDARALSPRRRRAAAL